MLAIGLGGIGLVACQDATSSLAPASVQLAAPLPSLTVNGNTMTLVGTELVLESGKRMRIDSTTANTFRSLAIAMPKAQESVRRMRPVWAKLGLPEPTSALDARLAVAAFRTRSTAASGLDVVPLTDAPVQKKPTMIAECDPVFTFCGFDTGTDPDAGGGGSSGGGGGGGLAPPICSGLLIQLYMATGVFASWANLVDQYRAELTRCMDWHPIDGAIACSQESGRMANAMSQLLSSALSVDSCVQSLRANHCI